jgi:hypothetical protein
MVRPRARPVITPEDRRHSIFVNFSTDLPALEHRLHFNSILSNVHMVFGRVGNSEQANT